MSMLMIFSMVGFKLQELGWFSDVSNQITSELHFSLAFKKLTTNNEVINSTKHVSILKVNARIPTVVRVEDEEVSASRSEGMLCNDLFLCSLNENDPAE